MRVDVVHRHLSFALLIAVGHSKLGRVVSDRLCAIVHLCLEVLQAERERQFLLLHPQAIRIIRCSHIGIGRLPDAQVNHSSFG